jgi:type I site-specific restriction endonuclease
LQFVCNVGVLTEGFDDAGVELVFMARPTKSRSLYAQMAGRATRPAEDIAHGLNDVEDAVSRRSMIERSAKPRCLIVDFVGNSGRHKLMTTADILGGNVSDEAVEQAVKMAREMGKPVDMAEALKRVEAEIRERKRAEEAKRAAMLARAKFSVSKVNPFDVLDISPGQERGWDRGKALSEKQAALLMRNKINPDGMPYHQAKKLIDEICRRYEYGLATYGQSRVLKQNGFSAPMRRSEAEKAINQIADRQGWKWRKSA